MIPGEHHLSSLHVVDFLRSFFESEASLEVGGTQQNRSMDMNEADGRSSPSHMVPASPRNFQENHPFFLRQTGIKIKYPGFNHGQYQAVSSSIKIPPSNQHDQTTIIPRLCWKGFAEGVPSLQGLSCR